MPVTALLPVESSYTNFPLRTSQRLTTSLPDEPANIPRGFSYSNQRCMVESERTRNSVWVDKHRTSAAISRGYRQGGARDPHVVELGIPIFTRSKKDVWIGIAGRKGLDSARRARVSSPDTAAVLEMQRPTLFLEEVEQIIVAASLGCVVHAVGESRASARLTTLEDAVPEGSSIRSQSSQLESKNTSNVSPI